MTRREGLINAVFLFAFLAVSTECENWGDVYSLSPLNEYRHPRCIEQNHFFETKEKLVEYLKSQDPRSFPHDRAFEIKPLEYDLEVETKEQERIEKVRETIETKREIKFK